jgi:adenylate cyclase, class 2
MLEREVKLRFPSGEAARAAVRLLGAVPLRPKRLQDDRLLDSEEERLSRSGCALRVRRDGDRAAVTWKGPVVAAAMKTRDEIESSVESADALEAIFGALGFTPRFRYQKYREELALDGLVIAIDETPVGTFVELEGEEAAIAAAAVRLDRTPADYVLASYRTLFLEYRAEHDDAGDHMVFDPDPTTPGGAP